MRGGYGSLIIISLFATVSYIGGLIIKKRGTKSAFVLVILISLMPLVFFKYADFICNTIFRLRIPELHTIIKSPLGISFYTFCGIAYLIDIYKGKIKRAGSFPDYFIYLSLFPCVISGPINRPKAMLEQIDKYDESDFNYDRCVNGFRYVLLGIFMKVLIAGRMAQTAAPYSNVADSRGLVLLIASICYTIQIFCDFCGYSYMAFGLSKVIGLDVIQNFRMPYTSLSVTEFWKRWHISLSSWLTEYVYIPLGGNRCSKTRSCFNVLVTFAVSGLWHGAAWTFLVWGILNGICIVTERITGFAKTVHTKSQAFCHRLLTIAAVNTMWIFFRANSITDAIIIVKKIVFDTIPDLLRLRSAADLGYIQAQLGVTFYEFCMILIAGFSFFIFELYADRKGEAAQIFEGKPTAVRWGMYVGIIALTLIFGATGKASEFIYAQF